MRQNVSAMSAALLIGSVVAAVADAQPAYQADPYGPNYQAPAAPPGALGPQPSAPLPNRPHIPPSWYCNPYTDGTVALPQGEGD